MKFTKILLCLSTLIAASLTQAADTSDAVIELPAVVVEASRIDDPLTTMRATLESRAHVFVPKQIHVRFSKTSHLVSSTEVGAKPVFNVKPAQRSPRVL